MAVFLCFPNVTSPFKGRTGLTASLQHYSVITALGLTVPARENTINFATSAAAVVISKTAGWPCSVMSLRLSCCFPGRGNVINLIESTLPLKGAELELLIVMKRKFSLRAQHRRPCQTPFKSVLRCRTHRAAYHRALYRPVRYMEYEYCGSRVSRTQPGDGDSAQLLSRYPQSCDAKMQ